MNPETPRTVTYPSCGTGWELTPDEANKETFKCKECITIFGINGEEAKWAKNSFDSKIFAHQLRGLVAGYFAVLAIAGITPEVGSSIFLNRALFDWWIAGSCILALLIAVLLFFRIRHAIGYSIAYTIFLQIASFWETQHKINRNLSYTSYYKFILSEQAALNILIVFALLAIRRHEKVECNKHLSHT